MEGTGKLLLVAASVAIVCMRFAGGQGEEGMQGRTCWWDCLLVCAHRKVEEGERASRREGRWAATQRAGEGWGQKRSAKAGRRPGRASAAGQNRVGRAAGAAAVLVWAPWGRQQWMCSGWIDVRRKVWGCKAQPSRAYVCMRSRAEPSREA